jgi:outer membrane protein assembly factor BamB
VIRPEEFVWAYPEIPPYADEARPTKNAPAVDSEGRIYLVTQGRLVALVEAESKAKVEWEYVIGSHVPGPVVVAADGLIRLHAADGLLHCVDSSGKQAWAPVRVGEPLGWAAPLVDASGNTYTSAYNGGLIRIDPDGKRAGDRYFRCRRKLDSAGVILRDLLVIGADDGYVFAIRLGEGRGVNEWNHAAEDGYAGGFVNSSPAISEDGRVLVIPAVGETLHGFSPTGAAVWKAKMPGQLLGSAVIDSSGHVYVGTSRSQRGRQGKGALVSVDGNSHKIRWEYAAAGPVESTPVIGDDGLVYFGDNAGVIHAVDAQGKAQWTAQVEAPVRSAATIVAPQRLAFALDDDTLVVLRCSSNGLARTGWPKIGRTLGHTGHVA